LNYIRIIKDRKNLICWHWRLNNTSSLESISIQIHCFFIQDLTSKFVNWLVNWPCTDYWAVSLGDLLNLCNFLTENVSLGKVDIFRSLVYKNRPEYQQPTVIFRSAKITGIVFFIYFFRIANSLGFPVSVDKWVKSSLKLVVFFFFTQHHLCLYEMDFFFIYI